MSNASRDNNFVPTKLAVLNTDGATIVPLRVNPTTHALNVSDGTTGVDHGPKNALHDQNFVPTLIGVSNLDFKTPVVAYADINGNLLTKST